MLEKWKKPAFILGILGAAKLALGSFGVDIPDNLINDIANGVSSILVLVGIIADHGKPKDGTV
ncbi:hypothetical protein ABEX47_13685 [Paenibacillus ehimensis]|uniref:hypothetical protein n=1 Tax=Paenibacillus ehimensis TaxID=79264 RepID=UPI003D2975D9